MNPKQRLNTVTRPVLTLGATPAHLAETLYTKMTPEDKRAWRKYCGKLQKIKGVDLVGYLEIILALNGSGLIPAEKETP